MENINQQAARGIKLLLGRQAALQAFTFAGGIVLARVLSPAEFGLFFIATFLVSLFALFGDFGLAASLIQRKDHLVARDLQVGFTVQQAATTVLVAAVIVSAPWLAHLYPKAPPETVWLVRALAFNLYLTSWRSISALQLERGLRYGRVAWIEVTEALSYQALTVGLAVAGFGVWSFVWATLVRGMVGTVLMYGAAPWRIRLAFDRTIARRLLRFGIPFQLQGLTNQLGSFVTPLVVGPLIGPHAVGLVGFAASNAGKPLILVDNVMRVAFPHFSRIQDDRDEVERVLSRYLSFLLVPAGLWIATICVAGPSLVAVVYTAKWTPAVPALILFSLALPFEILQWTISVTLNGLGLVDRVAKVVLARSIGTLALGVPLVFAIGLNAVPAAALATGIAAVPLLAQAFGKGGYRRLLVPQTWLLAPFGLTLGVGGASLAIPVGNPGRAVVLLLIVIGVYLATARLACPRELLHAVRRERVPRSLEPVVDV